MGDLTIGIRSTLMGPVVKRVEIGKRITTVFAEFCICGTADKSIFRE